MRLAATPALSPNYYAYTPATSSPSVDWAGLLKSGLQTALQYQQQQQMLKLQKAQLDTQLAQEEAARQAAIAKAQADAIRSAQAANNAAYTQGTKTDFVPLLLVGGGVLLSFILNRKK
jgi:hypothetical protein